MDKKTTSDQVKNTWGGVYNQSKLYNALMNQKYRGFTRCNPLVTLGLLQKTSLTCTSKIRKVWRRRKREKQHDLNNIASSVKRGGHLWRMIHAAGWIVECAGLYSLLIFRKMLQNWSDSTTELPVYMRYIRKWVFIKQNNFSCLCCSK